MQETAKTKRLSDQACRRQRKELRKTEKKMSSSLSGQNQGTAARARAAIAQKC